MTYLFCSKCVIFSVVKPFQGLQILSEVTYSIIEVMDFYVFCMLDFPLALKHYVNCLCDGISNNLQCLVDEWFYYDSRFFPSFST